MKMKSKTTGKKEDDKIKNKIMPFIKKTEAETKKEKFDKSESKKGDKKQDKKGKQPFSEKKCQFCQKNISKSEYYKLVSNKDYCLCKNCKDDIYGYRESTNEMNKFFKKFDGMFTKEETFQNSSHRRAGKKNELKIKIKNPNAKEDPIEAKHKVKYHFYVKINKQPRPESEKHQEMNNENEDYQDDMKYSSVYRNPNEQNDKGALIGLDSTKTIQDLFFIFILKYKINIDFYDINYEYKDKSGKLTRDHAEKKISQIFPEEVININLQEKEDYFQREMYYIFSDNNPPVVFNSKISDLFTLYFERTKEETKTVITKNKFLNYVSNFPEVDEYINTIFMDAKSKNIKEIEFKTLRASILVLAENKYFEDNEEEHKEEQENEINEDYRKEEEEPGKKKERVLEKEGDDTFLNLIIGFQNGDKDKPYLITYDVEPLPENQKEEEKNAEEDAKNAENEEENAEEDAKNAENEDDELDPQKYVNENNPKHNPNQSSSNIGPAEGDVEEGLENIQHSNPPKEEKEEKPKKQKKKKGKKGKEKFKKKRFYYEEEDEDPKQSKNENANPKQPEEPRKEKKVKAEFEGKDSLDKIEKLMKAYFKAKDEMRENPNLIVEDLDDLVAAIYNTIYFVFKKDKEEEYKKAEENIDSSKNEEKKKEKKGTKFEDIELYSYFYIINKMDSHKDRNEYSFNFLINYGTKFEDLFELLLSDIKVEIDQDIKEFSITKENKETYFLLEILHYIDILIKIKFNELKEDDPEKDPELRKSRMQRLMNNFEYENDLYYRDLSILITFLKTVKMKEEVTLIYKQLLMNKDHITNEEDCIKFLKILLVEIVEDKINKDIAEDPEFSEFANDKFKYYMQNYKEPSYHDILAYLIYYFSIFRSNDSLVNIYKNTLKKLYLITENENCKLSCIYVLTKFKNNRVTNCRGTLSNFKKTSNNLSSIYTLTQTIQFNRKIKERIIKDAEDNNINSSMAQLCTQLDNTSKEKNAPPVDIEQFFNIDLSQHLGLAQAAEYLQELIPDGEIAKTFDYFEFNGASDKIALLNYNYLDNPPDLLLVKSSYENFPKLRLELSPYAETYYKLHAILFEDYGDTYGFQCINLLEDSWLNLKKNSFVFNLKPKIANLCGISKDLFVLYKLKKKKKFKFTESYLRDFFESQNDLDKEMINVVLEYMAIDTKNVITNNWGKFSNLFKKDMYSKKKTIDYLSLYFDDIVDNLRTKYEKKGADSFLSKFLMLLESMQDEFQDYSTYNELIKRIKQY